MLSSLKHVFLTCNSPILSNRLHYLAETGDDFPCSFIFLQKDQKHGSKVIGHARLNKIIGNTSAAFLTCGKYKNEVDYRVFIKN